LHFHGPDEALLEVVVVLLHHLLLVRRPAHAPYAATPYTPSARAPRHGCMRAHEKPLHAIHAPHEVKEDDEHRSTESWVDIRQWPQTDHLTMSSGSPGSWRGDLGREEDVLTVDTESDLATTRTSQSAGHMHRPRVGRPTWLYRVW
jgi:hypothetical protein